jgi:energy-coupling factor transporter ATP-binding protein EcfA2
MTKIKSVVIRGLRGVREELRLELDGRSLLVYGDNGSGKSSITDALEWFYEDKIEHLSSEEIGRKGFEGMRNIFLDEGEPASLAIEYKNGGLSASKSLYLKKNTLKSEYDDGVPELEDYLGQSSKENLILRFRDLADFILASKKEKLDTLSEIIGFSEVSKTRNTLRKIVGELHKDIKRGNFDDRINSRQQDIIDQLGRNITSDTQFAEAVNEAVAPLKLGIQMKAIGDIDAILDAIEEPEDKLAVQLESFYKRAGHWAIEVKPVLDEIDRFYKEYYMQFNKIIGDIEQLSKILLERLLNEGSRLLKNNTFTEEACPLCLQPISRKKLLDDLDRRIGELKSFKKEQEALDGFKDSLRKELKSPMQMIDAFLREPHIKNDAGQELAGELEALKGELNQLDELTMIKLAPGSKLKSPDETKVDRGLLDRIAAICKEKALALTKPRDGDSKFDIQRKIILTKEAYSAKQRLERKKRSLLVQKNAMELIYSEFVKKQQKALEDFLTQFSSEIDSYYNFMNPGESVSKIRLKPLEKDEELQGITLEYSFFDETQSPPQKYLSESHLNCLGLAFFLTSVKAFNKQNKFFVLDDVISSFDSNHRKRFADLLLEKFSDYQILLLTHEREWFELIKKLMKGKNWLLKTVKWSEEAGTFLEGPPKGLKETIEEKIKKADWDGLGNKIRQYQERMLKEINEKLKVKMEYRSNDDNEHRMVGELLKDLRHHFKEKKNKVLLDNDVIKRLMDSSHLGNIGSHDSNTHLRLGDLKPYWIDTLEFEGLFLCEKCKKHISPEYYDNVGKKIRCKCGALKYDWKE